MKNHIAIAISVETPFQAKFSFVIYGPKRCRSIKLQDCLKYIMNEMWDKRLLQVLLPPLIGVARHTQIANQNAKLPEEQYLTKDLMNHPNFLYNRPFFYSSKLLNFFYFIWVH